MPKILNVPEDVMRLAEMVEGKPIAWKEYPDGWSVVFADGRKLRGMGKSRQTLRVSSANDPAVRQDDSVDRDEGQQGKPPRSALRVGSRGGRKSRKKGGVEA